MAIIEKHKEVWCRLISGDESALLELYQQHYQGLINYGCIRIKSREKVNDLFVEVIIQLWDKRSTLPVVENVRSYLLTSLRRKIADEFKKDQKRDAVHDKATLSAEVSAVSYEDYIISIQSNHRLQNRIRAALQKLTPRQNELIKLKFFDGLDYDTIAAQTGITKRTAYNIIHDAIRVLKDELYTEKNSSFQQNFIFFLLLYPFLFD